MLQPFMDGTISQSINAGVSTEEKAVRRAARRAERWRRREARRARRRPPKPSRLGEAGTARGDVIDVGAVDNDWTNPPPVTLEDGSRVRLFKDGQALTAALQAIQDATWQICIEVYIFHSDPTGRAFAEALAAKAAAGVNVFVIYDSFGSIDTDPAMLELMRRAGVHLAEFHPVRPWDSKFRWRPFNRDHRKLLVIDNQLAGLGGVNIGLEYGSGFLRSKELKAEVWRDNAIGLTGPAAVIFARCFAQTWDYVQQGGKLHRAEYLHDIRVGPRPAVRAARRSPAQRNDLPGGVERRFQSDLGVLASVPGVTGPLVPALQQLIRSAHRSLDMTVAYFAPSDELVAELCAAAKRGARVRLMFPGKSDVRIVQVAAHAFYETLLDCGVEVYERQGAVLHAKTIVVDAERAVIGSTNLDYRSIEYNLEISAVLRNREFGRQMTTLFEHDICYAKRIELVAWRSRPVRDRLIQWAVSRARYIL